ncbi:hypothetical protein J7443_17530 [Tropicibacter sp. R15_0]|uniref:hypothetical protein n=1 Tax=Tropicibacter sp. R15_0 TaxID=2821101 RepID=UPI001AD9CB8C|nr:hypothetical protein [Tropicibacter sp. R15_0]MBO9467049.1 hypothetical protein [Tropicibacter sp. R15_0]
MGKRAKRQPAALGLPEGWGMMSANPGAGEARNARPALVRDTVVSDGVGIDETGPEATAVIGSETVLRKRQNGLLADLPADQALALEQYSQAVEALGASGGTCDPTGGGGGANTDGPALRALRAAERLNRMHSALGRAYIELPLKNARRIRRGDRVARISLRDLTHWAVIDGLTRGDILERVGAARSNLIAQDAVIQGISEVGFRLSNCCGFSQSAERSLKDTQPAKR